MINLSSSKKFFSEKAAIKELKIQAMNWGKNICKGHIQWSTSIRIEGNIKTV